MSREEVNLHKWKEVASEVMGPDFFSNFFGGFDESQTSEPRYNLYQNSSEIVVLVEIPYIGSISQIKLRVHEKEIFLKGNRTLEYDHLDKKVEQLFSGSFEKRIPLPETVHTKNINAQYKQGLLIIQLFPIAGKSNGGRSVQIREL